MNQPASILVRDEPMRVPEIVSKQIWPVSSGKGGVGKSVISANMSICLAKKLMQKGKRVVVIDCDLANSSLSSFFGITNPPSTLKDFLFTKDGSLTDITMDTQIESLKLICGASDVPGIANLKYVQKMKIIDRIRKLDADYIILDLGTGTWYNVMDFFLMSNAGIIITTPDRISLNATFRFLKGCLIRKWIRRFSHRQNRKELINLIIKTIRTVKSQENYSMRDLVEEINRVDSFAANAIRDTSQMFRPRLILNMVRDSNARKACDWFSALVSKTLDLEIDWIGQVEYDENVRIATENLVPAVLEHSAGPFAQQLDSVVLTLLGDNHVMKRKERRSGKDQRSGFDLRKFNDPYYKGPDRRSGRDRRCGKDRRTTPHVQLQEILH